MDEFERLSYVTRRYAHLQGLRLVPLGIPFLASAAWRDGQLRWVPGTSGEGPTYWFVGLFLAALVVASAMTLYYRRRFGTVHQERGLRGPLLLSGFLLVFALSFWLQTILPAAVSWPAIVIGTALAYIGMSGGHPRTHYLALAAVCLVFATLGTFGVPFHVRDVLLDDLIGIGLIVVGIGDHLLLRRTLAPVAHVETI